MSRELPYRLPPFRCRCQTVPTEAKTDRPTSKENCRKHGNPRTTCLECEAELREGLLRMSHGVQQGSKSVASYQIALLRMSAALEQVRTAFGKYVAGYREGDDLWSKEDQEALTAVRVEEPE